MDPRKTNNLSLALLAATTWVVAACSGSNKPAPPAGGNHPPLMSAIADRMSDQDIVVGPIEFAIGDAESNAGLLTVSAAADGTDVVPSDGVSLAGSGAVRSITLTPLEAATGAVTVTLTVTDPQGASSMRSFRLTVNARNASLRDAVLTTFTKSEWDEVTPVNGFTFTQDADDPAIFAPLIGEGEE
jgi:hypothetical protein